MIRLHRHRDAEKMLGTYAARREAERRGQERFIILASCILICFSLGVFLT